MTFFEKLKYLDTAMMSEVEQGKQVDSGLQRGGKHRQKVRNSDFSHQNLLGHREKKGK